MGVKKTLHRKIEFLRGKVESASVYKEMIFNIYKMNKYIPNYIYEYTKYASLARFPVLEQELVIFYC